MICERCGKKFNVEQEKEDFEMEIPLKNYDNFEKNLCANCAIDSVKAQEEGIYFEYCEKCGKKYDPIKAESEFEGIHTNDYGTYASISDLTSELLCLDCAIDKYNNLNDDECEDN